MSLILNYKVEKNHSKHLFNFDNIEALARGEAPDGDHVVCRCSRMTSGSCAANNMSNVCGGGENYDCFRFTVALISDACAAASASSEPVSIT